MLPIGQPERQEGLKLVIHMLSQSQQIWNGATPIRPVESCERFADAFAKDLGIE